MMSGKDLVGSVVEARTATGGVAGRGVVVAFAEAPTYKIQKESGEAFTWVADLCTPLEPGESIAYWRNRAELAEIRLRELQK